MLRWSIALCLTSTGLALAAAETSQPVRRADKPNIVFILADDLGYTDVGCYGSGYYETPNIDRLAAQGMRFTNGYTCGPNCQPTRAALMSGQYGPRTGVYTVGSIERFDWRSRPLRPVDNVTELPLDKFTIARPSSGRLRHRDVRQVAPGEDPKHHPAHAASTRRSSRWVRHYNFPPTRSRCAQGAYWRTFSTDKASNFIRRHRDQPFFCTCRIRRALPYEPSRS